MRVEWRAVADEPTIRGPGGAVDLARGERFTWGRDWRPQGASRFRVLAMPSAISARALVTWWDEVSGRRWIFVQTAQGGARSDGHLDVYDADGLAHRLSERGSPRAQLRPGRYRAVLYVLDPVCELQLALEAPAGEAAGTPGGTGRPARLTTGVWDLDGLLDPGAPQNAIYATALLAVAATQFAGLRGESTPSRFFDVLLDAVLGRRRDWGNDRLAERVERRGIVLSKGSERIHTVARDTMEGLTPAQLDDLERWLAHRLGTADAPHR